MAAREAGATAQVAGGVPAMCDGVTQGQTGMELSLFSRDVIAVRFQGPRAHGMPELHKLTPCLASLQDKGFKVALITDGRMSGASGVVPAAIHITPECVAGGPLASVRDGDIIRLDSDAGVLEARVPAEEWSRRPCATADLTRNNTGTGRELFKLFRTNAAGAEQGGGLFL